MRPFSSAFRLPLFVLSFLSHPKACTSHFFIQHTTRREAQIPWKIGNKLPREKYKFSLAFISILRLYSFWTLASAHFICVAVLPRATLIVQTISLYEASQWAQYLEPINFTPKSREIWISSHFPSRSRHPTH